MGVRIRVLLLCLLVLLVGCAKSVPEGGSETAQSGTSTPPASGSDRPGPAPSGPTPPPSAPVAAEPRLMLDLPLGDEPDQPGLLPARVGGVSPRGPLSLAADKESLYLADAAKNRILQYDRQSRLVRRIPAPWLDDQVADLAVSPFGLNVILPSYRYTMDLDGRMLAISEHSPAADGVKEMSLIGTDTVGNRYEWAMSDPSGTIVRRVSSDGRTLASAPVGQLGEIQDWYVTRDGGLYALSYQWGQQGPDRVKVYEVLAPGNLSSGPGGFDPTPSPVVMGYPLPTRIQLTFADWAPVEVTAEAYRWNIWQLLSTAVPAVDSGPGPDSPSVGIEATLPDGSSLSLTVLPYELRVGGKRYQLPFYQGLDAVVQQIRFSEASLKTALTEATSVRVALLDLPGVERELTAAERERLRQSLTGAIPASSAAGPHPLEAPFPQYGIHLDGKGWKGTVRLQGDRYLRTASGGSVLHRGELTRLVTAWLPVPELTPADVGYLYRADKLEIGQGTDLTRWKNSVVRRLVGAQVIPGYQPTATEPFTLTFWVAGERLTVPVDLEGFTYGGKRHPASGLTEIARFQGVP